MSQNLLADLLNISKYRLSQLKRHGCPVDSFTGAAAWLFTNVTRRNRSAQ